MLIAVLNLSLIAFNVSSFFSKFLISSPIRLVGYILSVSPLLNKVKEVASSPVVCS